MKLGLILECQFDGPDEKVLRCLLANFAPEIEVQTAAQGSKTNLVRDCGTAARQLLADGCDHVVIVWDLYPAEWGDALRQKNRVPCLHNDRERIHAALQTAGVDSATVALVAIEFMLESWLLADTSALAAFLSKSLRREITGQQVGGHKPSREKKPKDTLSKIFEQHGHRSYQRFRPRAEDRERSHGFARFVASLSNIPKILGEGAQGSRGLMSSSLTTSGAAWAGAGGPLEAITPGKAHP